jgi:UPF0755 protein
MVWLEVVFKKMDSSSTTRSSFPSIKKSDIVILSVVFTLLIVVTLGLREVANQPSNFEDFASGVSTESATVVINKGDTGEEIARTLEKAGVIASWQKFFEVAVSDLRSARIAPGTYEIDMKIPAAMALEQLLDLDRIQGLLVLRDGVRLVEVVTLLKANGFTEVEEALEEAKVPEPFTYQSLEGFLYPAKYSFAPGTSTSDVIETIIARFDAAMSGIVWPKKESNRLITIASLVEAEGTPDVFPKIARVILNRLERGMPLQLDSTVHYIQNSRGEIALSLKETEIDSPYNTYRNRGLPPGPIGSPTRAAVEAVLAPAKGEWLYFITVAPKETRFTSSYDEFLEWKRLYRENYRKGLFDD